MTSAVQRFFRHAPTHDVASPARPCVDAFRRPRFARARPPATITGPPWLVRSPAPASLGQNEIRRLPNSATRHDPRARLPADRSSPVWGSGLLRSLCVCRVVTPLPEDKPSQGRFLGRPQAQQRVTRTLRFPCAGEASERRTRITRAPLLEALPSTLVRHRHAATEAWSASAAGSSIEAFVPTTPREGSRFPEDRGCFPPYAWPPGLLPTGPPFPGADPPSRCTR